MDIKQKRLELGLTMKELSTIVGVSEATISRWESGNIKNMKRDKMFALAKALHISPLDLTDLEFDIENNLVSPKNQLINQIVAKISDFSNDDLIKLNTIIDTIFDKRGDKS